MLLALGYAILSADDGQDGIEQMLKHNGTVHVILMDQSMPRKDGVNATREIRELEQVGRLSRRTPIIAVTAVVNTESKRLFEEAGADDFLAKPLSLDKLRDTLTLYLPRG
jgi:CheY-like chemotaxis protein